MTARPVTLRERIINELVTRIGAMVDENDDPLWNNVVIGDIKLDNPLATPVVGVQPGPEEIVYAMWPTMDKQLTVFLEIRFMPQADIDSWSQFSYYLGMLETALTGDAAKIYLGGLANWVRLVGDNNEIEGSGDPSPGGVLTLLIQYRHREGDPYHTMSES